MKTIRHTVNVPGEMEPLLNERIQDFRSLSGYFVSLGLPTCSIFPSGRSQKPSRMRAGNSNSARLRISKPCASTAGGVLTCNRIWKRLLR